MKLLLKYFIWLLSLTSLVLYYLLGTTLGHVSIASLSQNYVNQKFGKQLKVLSLNIEKYPYIVATLKVNETALLFVKGEVERDNINLNYHLKGESFHWNNYHILQAVNLKGKMNGTLKELFITGKGEIFDGKTNYSFLKEGKRFDALKVTLNDVRAEPLLKILNYDFKLKGKVNAKMNFEYFMPFRKKGVLELSMKDAIVPNYFPKMPIALNAKIAYRDLFRQFSLDAMSKEGEVHLVEGKYNKSAALLTANYHLQLKELAHFKRFFKQNFYGPFETRGTLKYDKGKPLIKGETKSYEGVIEYLYANEELTAELKGVSLEKLLRQVSFPALLSAQLYGSVSYGKDKILLINTKLREARFRRTNMTDVLKNLTGIDIVEDIYDKSLFAAAYENSILTSMLHIDNGVNHLYLNNTRMNAKTNEVTGEFDVFIDRQEFLGDIYGTLDDPKVNLDMSKLIKYQINKKINNFFGRGKALNKKNTKEKLKEIKSKTGSFLEKMF